MLEANTINYNQFFLDGIHIRSLPAVFLTGMQQSCKYYRQSIQLTTFENIPSPELECQLCNIQLKI